MFPHCRKSCSSSGGRRNVRPVCCFRNGESESFQAIPGNAEQAMRRRSVTFPESFRDIHITSVGSVAGSKDLILPVISISISKTFTPAASPAAFAPLAAAPARKLIAVDDATFAKLEHAVLAVAVASVDAQSLDSPRIRVFAKSRVAHPEGDIRAS